MDAFPERFGEFLLLRRLSVSLMAEVFVAIKLGDRDGHTVVIKRPKLGERASGESAQAILREAEVLSEVRAPTLVALEQRGEVAGLPFVAIEHVRGVALDRVLSSRGAMSPSAAFAVGRDILRALAALHDAGWVHADVAPSNVVIDEGGEAKLIDLGIALREGEERDVVAGKPGYVAPEVPAHKPASPAEDVYAAAVVITECLRGRRLFPEQDIAEAAARTEVPNGVNELPLGNFLVRALSRTPSDRIDARELANALPDDAAGRSELSQLSESVIRESRVPDAPQDPRSRGQVSKTEVSAPLFPSSGFQTSDAASSMTTRAAPAPLSTPASAPLVAPAHSVWRTVVFIAGSLMLAVFALFFGFAAGRRAVKPRETSITLPVVTPRTEVNLDGRTVVVTEPGRTLPISPGEHTLSFSFRKREKDLVIGVHEGQNVVLVPVLMQKPDTNDKPADKPADKPH